MDQFAAAHEEWPALEALVSSDRTALSTLPASALPCPRTSVAERQLPLRKFVLLKPDSRNSTSL
jgi:hypothetical protein